jgi:hypothetical protein
MECTPLVDTYLRSVICMRPRDFTMIMAAPIEALFHAQPMFQTYVVSVHIRICHDSADAETHCNISWHLQCIDVAFAWVSNAPSLDEPFPISNGCAAISVRHLQQGMLSK